MKRVCIPAAVAVLLLALFSCKDTNEQAPSETTYVYAVEHYKEQPGGIFPEASDISETLEGITGKEKSFTPQSFEGFTWDESLTEKGDTVIKLYYRRNAVTVRFNLDGGTVDTALTDGCLTGRFGEKLVISDPEKDGQDFTGWSPEVPDSFPAEAMQYTALWSLISYPVVYELNGGTNSEKNPQTYTYEDELTLSIPVRTGYVFSGWYTEPDFSGTPVIQIVRHTSGELHVYAKWDYIIYTISYNPNGGKFYSTPIKSFCITSDTLNVSLGKVSRTGYIFRYWRDENGSEVSKITKEYLSKDENKEKRIFHFTAVWKRK